jgi:hypothetical protein
LYRGKKLPKVFPAAAFVILQKVSEVNDRSKGKKIAQSGLPAGIPWTLGKLTVDSRLCF